VRLGASADALGAGVDQSGYGQKFVQYSGRGARIVDHDLREQSFEYDRLYVY
jgi:hypothetical protein